MKSECDVKKSLIEQLKDNHNAMLIYELLEYRRKFISIKKNINRYKTNGKATPRKLDNLFNSFDRKIKCTPILTNEIKKKYLNGIQLIYEKHYEEERTITWSRKDAYYYYRAHVYVYFGKNFSFLSFNDFIMKGMYKYFK